MGCPFGFISLKSQCRSNYTPAKKLSYTLELLKHCIKLNSGFWDVCAFFWFSVQPLRLSTAEKLTTASWKHYPLGVVQIELPLFVAKSHFSGLWFDNKTVYISNVFKYLKSKKTGDTPIISVKLPKPMYSQYTCILGEAVLWQGNSGFQRI